MNGTFVTQIDGLTAGADDLAPLAFAGFAHFTAMQVRDGGVRGLDLHLERLRFASLRFFGKTIPDDLVRRHLRTGIVAGPAALSLTATMFSRAGEFTRMGEGGDPALLVRTSPAAYGPSGPLRLAMVANERPIPEIKHTGEAVKTFYLRQAVRKGYDDAAFIDANGCISEATIWNLAFWDGEAIVWPRAALLPGITMSIVRRQLGGLGVRQREEAISAGTVRELRGAALMNSWKPNVEVAAFGDMAMPSSSHFLQTLHEA